MSTGPTSTDHVGFCHYLPRGGFGCPAIVRWRLLPACDCGEDVWPPFPVCTKHMGNAVELLTELVTCRCEVSTVRVESVTVRHIRTP
jgi:hypothetical protein